RLRRYPPLRAFLIADGKRKIEAARNEAHAEVDEFEITGKQWTTDLDYDLRLAAGSFISVLVTNAYYTGGAHGYAPQYALLWSKPANWTISVADFFIDSADGGAAATALDKLVEDELTHKRIKNGGSSIPPTAGAEALPARLSDLDKSMTLAPS